MEDKKLTDKGWKAMEQLLNREMPVERKRRPIPWLWMAACLTGTSLFLGWMFWPSGIASEKNLVASGRNGTAVESSEATLPTAAAPATEWNAPRAENANADRMIQQPAATASKPASKPNTPYAGPGNTTHQPGFTTPDVAVAGAIQDPENAIGTNSETQQLSTKTAETEPVEVVLNNQVEVVPTEIVAAVPRINYLLSPLPPITPAPVQQSTIAAVANFDFVPTTSASAPIQPVHPDKQFSLGLTAGIFLSPESVYKGFNGGVMAEWQPHTSWGLRSGISYQFEQLRDKERTILSLTTSDYFNLTGDQEALIDPSSINTGSFAPAVPVYIPVSRLHRLEVPVQAFWHPAKKWRLYGGAAVGTTLFVQPGDRSLKNTNVLEIQNGSPARRLTTEISNQVRSVDFRWNVGVGFKPNRRLSIDLFLHNPLNLNKQEKDQSFLASDTAAYKVSEQKADGVTTHRTLQLSVGWLF